MIRNTFNQAKLEPGKVYFLNRQKLGRKSLLVRGTPEDSAAEAQRDLLPMPDARAYTMWDTLANTIADEQLTLYLILDEAHRGMKQPNRRDRAEKATIVQQLINGAMGVPPLPIVWGISATVQRFNEAMERAVVCEDGGSYATALRAALGAYLDFAPLECLSALGRLEAFAGPSEHVAGIAATCGRMAVGSNQMTYGQFVPIDHQLAQRALEERVVTRTVNDIRTDVISTASRLRGRGYTDLANDVLRLLDDAIEQQNRGGRADAAAGPGDLEVSVSLGSGFILPSRLLAATNYHVVEGATSVEVWSPQLGEWYPTRIVRSDPANDLALVEVPEAMRPSATAVVYGYRSSTDIRVGTEVHAIGFPLSGVLGSRPRFTTGTISADVGISDDPRLVQTTASIQPGNSGGPLVDAFGQIIGVVVSTLNSELFLERTGSVPQNVNFAIKIDYLRLLAGDQFGEPGTLPRSALPGSDVAEQMAPWIVRIRAVEN